MLWVPYTTATIYGGLMTSCAVGILYDIDLVRTERWKPIFLDPTGATEGRRSQIFLLSGEKHITIRSLRTLHDIDLTRTISLPGYAVGGQARVHRGEGVVAL